MRSQFLIRTLTASVLVGVFVGALFAPERGVFVALTVLLVAGAAYEWARLCRLPPPRAGLYTLSCVVAFGFPMLGLLSAENAGRLQQMAFGVASVFWIFLSPLMLGMRWDRRTAFLPGLGILVIVPAAMALLAIPPGLLVAALMIAWVSDTGAYLGGRAFGRRKLAPAISPGKTWEGAICGLGCVLIYAIIYQLVVPDTGERLLYGGWAVYLSAAALLCSAGVVGDLLESAMKRQAGVKDSGSILPGHGGILDRIDSATAILPVTAFLLQWAGPG